ncbi:Protein of unknown function [Burkholderia sp. GAS332]|nr:Protein of unknown function [Burkholderia sp. GAS332]
MFRKYSMLVAALLGAAVMSVATPAMAQPADPQVAGQPQPASQAGTVAHDAFGPVYAPVAAVDARQAQVVYYRPASPGQAAGGANVYLDGQLHTALLSAGYSIFCVAAGEHSLGAFVNDAPRYQGRSAHHEVTLEGGQTYFLRVREDGNGTPLPVARAQAERELAGARAQLHALSRAGSIQACRYVQAAS